MRQTMFALMFVLMGAPVEAAETFPTKGVFTEADSESELNFKKRYLGFPDEECSFSAPKKLAASKWSIKLKCNVAEGRLKDQRETATLERKGKGWHLVRTDKTGNIFTLDFKP